MQNDLEFIGELALVQVQKAPLKTGGPRNRYYAPIHLVAVPEALLTPRGVIGIAEDGTQILDAHHADHPQSRFSGANGISIGFTGHYERMRSRFGDHLADGAAGENLIISGPLAPGHDDLTGRLVFENPDGTRVEFKLYRPMAPCNEFSHFANGSEGTLPADVLKETLQFLNGGTRGLALELVDAGEVRLISGARLFKY